MAHAIRAMVLLSPSVFRIWSIAFDRLRSRFATRIGQPGNTGEMARKIPCCLGRLNVFIEVGTIGRSSKRILPDGCSRSDSRMTSIPRNQVRINLDKPNELIFHCAFSFHRTARASHSFFPSLLFLPAQPKTKVSRLEFERTSLRAYR